MSDRRSFSEIPAELLREQGVDARVDRIWQRLEQDARVTGSPRRAMPRFSLALSAVTFVAGVLVGTGFVRREPLQLTSLGAEPTSVARPASAPVEPAAFEARAAADAPRSPQARHSPSARHVVGVVVPEPMSESMPAAPALTPLTGPVEWQRLADEGEYTQALAALSAVGGFDAALRDASADQLRALVAVARATGQRDRAIVALRRIVSEHGADPNAPVAAWMLGNELAKTRDLASAEQAFAMYRALSPNGDFAEDALARQIDMAADQGNLEHGRKLAGQYLKEFPDGPRTAEIRARLEQWGEEPAPSAVPEQPAVAALPDAGAVR